MNNTYFLGANSENGFYSLYEGFARGGADILHIIKGGPGTGKSGFMRKIAESAQARGLEVEYVLCSGDPDSLDGVYIPAMHEGFMDGTAPHVADPEYFAASGDYINIGSFCRLPFSDRDRVRVKRITQDCKREYDSAYSYLKAAGAVSAALGNALIPEDFTASVRQRAEELLPQAVSDTAVPNAAHRFISAISCAGEMASDILCKQYYVIASAAGLQYEALGIIYELCSERGIPVIACHSPLMPERLEALLLPGADTAFVSDSLGFKSEERIELDALLPAAALRAALPGLRENEKLKQRLVSLATDKLKTAKALHDELEAVYRPYMDFDALTKFTDEYTQQLFSCRYKG